MFSRHHRKNGFAILIVLVAVVILMLLYFVQIDTFFGPGLPSQPAGIEQHPWVLSDLLVPGEDGVKLPRPPKPRLEDPFSVSAPVRRDDLDRGTVTVSFETDGRITAQWQCTYEQEGKTYQVEAAMKGNIHVKQTYEDEQGKDKSRLFFIAKGAYTKQSPDDSTGFGSEKGTAWLTGWVRPDHRIQGHVTLTTDETWAAAYAFAGSP